VPRPPCPRAVPRAGRSERGYPRRAAAGWPDGAASTRIHRTHVEPRLEMWPCRTFTSELRSVGVSPAHAQSLRAEGNRQMSPISATKVSAVSRPTPGKVIRA
jgi:hypothetical protein